MGITIRSIWLPSQTNASSGSIFQFFSFLQLIRIIPHKNRVKKRGRKRFGKIPPPSRYSLSKLPRASRHFSFRFPTPASLSSLSNIPHAFNAHMLSRFRTPARIHPAIAVTSLKTAFLLKLLSSIQIKKAVRTAAKITVY